MIGRRSWLGMILLTIVTCGFDCVYWFYDTARELIAANGENASAALWTVLLVFPLEAFFSYWFYAKAFERFTGAKVHRGLLYALLLIVPIAGWVVVQLELNDATTRIGRTALPA